MRKYIILAIVFCAGCDLPTYDSDFCRDYREYHEAIEQCKAIASCKLTRREIEVDMDNTRSWPACFKSP